MDFTGRYVIAAPPQKVWDAIYDPDVLRTCIPGCEALERISPTDFRRDRQDQDRACERNLSKARSASPTWCRRTA